MTGDHEAKPAKDKDTGTSIIICPGGGHNILAFDHEGTEVAEWLNTLGVTGIVLKYRVPFRNPNNKSEAAVQDAQRAVRMVRANAKEWGLDAARIGILGFSAGGETAGLAAINHKSELYKAIDKVDEASARPDFAVLVYPAYLVESKTGLLLPSVKVTAKTPPTFLAHAFDDPVTPVNSLQYALELKRFKVPCELHLYSAGGHGYALEISCGRPHVSATRICPHYCSTFTELPWPRPPIPIRPLMPARKPWVSRPRSNNCCS